MVKIPEDRHAGAEIEVTPEMVEAGFDVLLNHGVTELTQNAALEVYRAMASRAPDHQRR